MNALTKTLVLIRAFKNASGVKVKRSFTDFVADRIIQAATERHLISMMERIANLLDVDTSRVNGDAFVGFLKAAQSSEASAVHEWLRQYPRVAAMIASIHSNEEFFESVEQIEVDGVGDNPGTAFQSPNYDVPICVTCLSPLSHGSDSKAGNATVFRRMKVLSTTGQVLALPFYAGNAVRGQVRDLLADHFLATLGLAPRRDDPPCKLWFFHALYAGGALEENSQQAKKIGEKLGKNGALKADGMHELRNMIPPISALGAALGNRIISGRANFGDLRPECIEWANGKSSAGALFEWTYLTRREDHEQHAEGNHSGMIVNVETLRSGTRLHGGVDISKHATDIESACISRGLNLLADRGYIGAENRRGFGKVMVETHNLPDPDVYDSYLSDKKDLILAFLQEIGAIYASSELDSQGA